MPTLREVLTTPFILYVEAVRGPGGEWVRRASFPELEGCAVLAPTAWGAVEELERHLPRYLVERVRAGRPVPLPPWRPALHDLPAEDLLRAAGLDDWAGKLDSPVEDLAR